MDSMLPSLSPSASTMIRSCQARTVSRSGMSCSLLVDLVMSGLVAAGRRASAVQRRPTDFWLAAPAGTGALPAAGVVQVGRAGPLGGRVLGGPTVAVELVGLSLGGRGLGLLAQLGTALLGLAGHPVPVPLHGPDAAAAHGHDDRADHGGQQRVPEAGDDPGGDLE